MTIYTTMKGDINMTEYGYILDSYYTLKRHLLIADIQQEYKNELLNRLYEITTILIKNEGSEINE